MLNIYTDDYEYDASQLDKSKIFTITLGCITFLFPLSVVFILLYSYNTLMKDRRLTQLVFMISFSDLMASIATILGYPKGSTCIAQGFIMFFFCRSSWLYTLALITQLFCFVLFKKYYIDDRMICFIIWPINTLLQLLPLSSGVQFGQQQPNSRCLLTPGNNFSAYRFWLNLVFRDVLLAVFIIIFFLTLIILIYRYKYIEKGDPVNKTIDVIMLYPSAMFVAWIPITFYNMYRVDYKVKYHSYPVDSLVLANYLEACVSIYGVLVSLIFYTKTQQARKEYYLFYCQLFNLNSDDSRSSISSDESEDKDKIVTNIVISDVKNPYNRDFNDDVLKASQQI